MAKINRKKGALARSLAQAFQQERGRIQDEKIRQAAIQRQNMLMQMEYNEKRRAEAIAADRFKKKQDFERRQNVHERQFQSAKMIKEYELKKELAKEKPGSNYWKSMVYSKLPKNIQLAYNVFESKSDTYQRILSSPSAIALPPELRNKTMGEFQRAQEGLDYIIKTYIPEFYEGFQIHQKNKYNLPNPKTKKKTKNPYGKYGGKVR